MTATRHAMKDYGASMSRWSTEPSTKPIQIDGLRIGKSPAQDEIGKDFDRPYLEILIRDAKRRQHEALNLNPKDYARLLKFIDDGPSSARKRSKSRLLRAHVLDYFREHRHLTWDQLAQIFGLTKSHVAIWCKNAELPTIPIGDADA